MTQPVTRGEIDRLAALYTGAVADVMDGLGYRNQALPREIRPLDNEVTLAGVVFTVRGRALWSEPEADPRYKQIEMLEAVTPDSVIVLDPGGEADAAHWGELMSTTAMAAGALGAVINGGLRDVRKMRELGFPVFGRFFSPLTAVFRWELTDYQVPLVLDGVVVRPGDVIHADEDGVLCIPQEIFHAVLEKAEEVVSKEDVVHNSLLEGTRIRELFEEHGVF